MREAHSLLNRRNEESPNRKETHRQSARTSQQPTPQEYAIWRLISRYRPKFTRQLTIKPYVADPACRQAKLIVEIDGSQHIDSEDDLERSRALEAQGWTIIRFWNSEVDENPEGVATTILLRAAECLGGTHPQPISPDPKDHAGHGPPG